MEQILPIHKSRWLNIRGRATILPYGFTLYGLDDKFADKMFNLYRDGELFILEENEVGHYRATKNVLSIGIKTPKIVNKTQNGSYTVEGNKIVVRVFSQPQLVTV